MISTTEPKLQFVTRRRNTGLVSVYQVYWMEESFRKLGIGVRTAQRTRAMEVAAKVLAKSGVLRTVRRPMKTLSIVPVNGLSEYMTFPVCYSSNIATYCFDCWPDRYDEWIAFFRRHRPVVAFISAKASAGYMQRQLPDLHFVWAPEATNPEAYDDRIPTESRGIDLLELGRRCDSFHEQLRPALAQTGRVHLFERIRGEKIFGNDREKLVEGLANSKLVACFPATMTHGFSGGVETMTHRYVEAMAAGCLPVGHAPAELIELFGYNPVAEIDLTAAARDVRAILDQIDKWEPLIRRNKERLLQVGTWDVRAKAMVEAIKLRIDTRFPAGKQRQLRAI